MAAAQEYYVFLPLRGGHLSCHFLSKAVRTCQSDLNDLNKNNCKGKMFWLTPSAAGFSGNTRYSTMMQVPIEVRVIFFVEAVFYIVIISLLL